MSDAILNMLLKALCAILCQFCDCCEDHEECPDGVCQPIRDAVDGLESRKPVTTANSTGARFDFNWGEMRATVEAITAAVNQIAKLFGLNGQKVG